MSFCVCSGGGECSRNRETGKIFSKRLTSVSEMLRYALLISFYALNLFLEITQLTIVFGPWLSESGLMQIFAHKCH